MQIVSLDPSEAVASEASKKSKKNKKKKKIDVVVTELHDEEQSTADETQAVLFQKQLGTFDAAIPECRPPVATDDDEPEAATDGVRTRVSKLSHCSRVLAADCVLPPPCI